MLEIDKTFHRMISQAGLVALLGALAMYVYSGYPSYGVGFFFATMFMLSSLAE